MMAGEIILEVEVLGAFQTVFGLTALLVGALDIKDLGLIKVRDLHS
jgi:hypothetical protein